MDYPVDTQVRKDRPSYFVTPLVSVPYVPQKLIDVFWSKVDVRSPDECWTWQLGRNAEGYGKVSWSGRLNSGTGLAHRVAWVVSGGTLGPEDTIDHMCRNRPCCNPTHLRVLSRSENSSNNGFKIRTHCPSGHAYDETNTYVSPRGHRSCRACSRERQRKVTKAISDKRKRADGVEVHSTRLQRLVAEQQRLVAASNALAAEIDAEMYEREQAGTPQSDLAREVGDHRQNVNRRIQRHRSRLKSSTP